MKHLNQLFVFLFILLAFSCTKPPDYSDTPVIDFIGLSRPTIVQDNSSFPNAENSIWIDIGFTDGDGDIGLDSTGAKQLVIIDTHFNAVTSSNIEEISVPLVPEQGAGNGISGVISFRTTPTCCVYQNPGFETCEVYEGYPTDTLIYEVFLTDRAGNESNHIFTDQIIILCQ